MSDSRVGRTETGIRVQGVLVRSREHDGDRLDGVPPVGLVPVHGLGQGTLEEDVTPVGEDLVAV